MLSLEQPATLREIAERAAMTVEQVRYHIVGGQRGGGKLMIYGLVGKHGSRHYYAHPATDEQLDELVARPCKTLGKGERRRQKHAVERGLYAGNLIVAARYKHDLENFLPDRLPTPVVEGDDLFSPWSYLTEPDDEPGISQLNPFSRKKLSFVLSTGNTE
jgi:hypothetical protein